MNWNLIITSLSALLAGLSFIIIALPLLERLNRKSRYEDVISRRRRDLYDAAQKEGKTPAKPDMSASQSVAHLFRMEQIIGKMARDLRSKLAQAGYRGPLAPLKFIIARIVLPLVFVGLAMMVLSKTDKDIPQGIQMLGLFALAAFGYALPGLLLKNSTQKRQMEINATFPDALDMMLVCVQGGISIEQAINRIADEMADHAPTLAEEIGLLGAELGLLSNRRDAFTAFAARVGSGAAKSFATSMIQAEKYGTHISTALRVMADDLREARMAEAERKAASLPPKLTVPMILFFMPALFIVILGPAFLQAANIGR